MKLRATRLPKRFSTTGREDLIININYFAPALVQNNWYLQAMVRWLRPASQKKVWQSEKRTLAIYYKHTAWQRLSLLPVMGRYKWNGGGGKNQPTPDSAIPSRPFSSCIHLSLLLALRQSSAILSRCATNNQKPTPSASLSDLKNKRQFSVLTPWFKRGGKEGEDLDHSLTTIFFFFLSGKKFFAHEVVLQKCIWSLNSTSLSRLNLGVGWVESWKGTGD